ncbi:MAG: tRNA (adenosine(37)-N6)-dimethylallyltransferase MiaA [Oscillospiraceae bacterium]|jgi:tRNA dimethylallyltransferase|nr:tRNA (adenosine(37)-N6)-dimethylallyltransferase MiaA [Oscillospiraceae bacterium]
MESGGTQPKIIVITGATATGKTVLAAALCVLIGGEVVSSDSMQIYRRMNIGTAKPTAEQTRGIAHHCIDIAEPEDDYSVAEYVKDGRAAVLDILARGKIPVVCGGTGLYTDSLVRGGADFAARNDALRRGLELEYERVGGEAMLERLAAIDPASAEKLSPNDRKRVLRALEIHALTGKTKSELDALTKTRPPEFSAKYFVLHYADRQELYGRINARVDAMLAEGLIAEVEELLASGVPRGATSMQAIGYKEIADELARGRDFSTAGELIKQRSRNYAKRQETWFRRYEAAERIVWPSAPNEADIEAAAQNAAKQVSDFLHTGTLL